MNDAVVLMLDPPGPYSRGWHDGVQCSVFALRVPGATETDPYEKVRDFYKTNAPQGYSQSFMNENTSDGNREFALWFARADGKAWYVITVHEEKDEGKVVVTVAQGQGQWSATRC